MKLISLKYFLVLFVILDFLRFIAEGMKDDNIFSFGYVK